MYYHTPGRVGWSGQTPLIKGGHFFIWRPGDQQFYGNEHRPLVHSWFNCEGSLVDRLIESNRIPVREILQMPSADSFLRFLADLYRELCFQSPPDEAIAENLLENWIRDLGRTIRGHQEPVPERLRGVREYIDIHCVERLSIGQLSEIAHCCPTHLSNLFRKHFGTSPIDYAIRQRMYRAAYLLRDINLSISEIANRVGFEDIYYFSKLFKKRWGMTARQMRQSFQKEQVPPLDSTGTSPGIFAVIRH